MVDESDVRDTAENARLNLSDDEVEQLENDMNSILDAFRSLDELDTDDVEPAFHPINIDQKPRSDEPEDCLSQDEALSNTKNKEDGYFKGPRSV